MAWHGWGWECLSDCCPETGGSGFRSEAGALEAEIAHYEGRCPSGSPDELEEARGRLAEVRATEDDATATVAATEGEGQR